MLGNGLGLKLRGVGTWTCRLCCLLLGL